MLIEKKPHCTIEYDPNSKCILQTWIGFAGSENFRASIMKTIETVIEYGARSVISNTKNSKVVAPDDIKWLAEYANPILLSHGVRKVAFVESENPYTCRSTSHFRGQTLATEYFDSVDKAKAWISE